MTDGWRLSVTNSSARSRTTFTGRPALRASAASGASWRTNVLAPNEPPIGAPTMRTRSSSTPNATARSVRRLKRVWVPLPPVRPQVERRLRSRPHGEPAAVVPLRDRGVRLHRDVRGARRAERLLDDHVRLRESRRDGALHEPEAVADVRAGKRAHADRHRLL